MYIYKYVYLQKSFYQILKRFNSITLKTSMWFWFNKFNKIQEWNGKYIWSQLYFEFSVNLLPPSGCLSLLQI